MNARIKTSSMRNSVTCKKNTARPLILICNDDGIYAPGILALFNAVRGLGEVAIVAPASEQSCTGHSITLNNPIKIARVRRNKEFEGYGVYGTQADCVKLALSSLLPGIPRLVISGINLGPNAGISVLYSGTVSAAAEGAILGIPSMAVSLATFTKPVWKTAARAARLLAKKIISCGLPPNTLLNVNVPNLPYGRLRGTAITSMGHSRFAEVFHERKNPSGDTYYWMDGELEITGKTEGTDIRALSEGYVTVTPIRFDLTDTAALAALKKWRLPGGGHSPREGR